MMSARSSLFGFQLVSERSLLAFEIRIAGSPSLLGAFSTLKFNPLTFFAASITYFTLKPLPYPTLKVSLPFWLIYSSALMWASARSLTCM